MKLRRKLFQLLYLKRYDVILEFVTKGGMILDLGCGPGSMLKHLNNLGYVVGLDLFPHEWEKTAKVKLGSSNTSALIKGDARNLPFLMNSFDIIIAADVLEHIQDIGRAVNEIWGTLKLGGVLVVSIPRENWLYKIFRVLYRGTWKYTSTLKGDDHYNSIDNLVTLLNEKFMMKTSRNTPSLLHFWRIIQYIKVTSYEDN